MKRIHTLAALSALVLTGLGHAAPASEPSNESKAEPARFDEAVQAGKAEAAKLGKPKGGKPGGLREHLVKLKQALPPSSTEGPAAAGDAGFLQRAYPDDDIPLARIEAARNAAKALAGRNFPSGKGRPGMFVSVGPQEALFPRSPYRSSLSYIPTDYVAAGRTVALAIDPNCSQGQCRLWAAPAGGGIWRTKNALDGQPHWQYLSGPFGINAVGSITLDPNDASGNTLWVGTGEANGCGSGCIAGVGIYKSTDGGDSWTGPLGASSFNARAVGSIAVKPGDPLTIYAASVRAGRGASSVATGGVVTLVPGAPQWGLYKSSDGGASWTYLHNGSASAADCPAIPLPAQAGNGTVCSPRGVRQVELDPVDPNTVYAASFGRGVWRSSDGGASWVQIKPSLNAAQNTTRPMLAVNRLANGNTRLYVAEGNVGAPYARLFRSDDARSAAPVFSDMTSNNPANPGYGSYNFCSGQCWYDNFVVSPAGYPDIVYLGGSYAYGETGGISNGRGVVLSTDGGVSFTDMTMDGSDPVNPNGLHPDQHYLVVQPGNPYRFFEASDGGIVRSSGLFADVSVWCDARGLGGASLARCKQLLSRVPSKLESMNKGLSTLQFQSLSVSPHNVNIVQGGTQDNGTWQSSGNPVRWINTMIGDGGQSGFDVADPQFRFHTFYDASPDVNFSGGEMGDWNWIGDPIYGTGGQFYVPIISDPKVSKTMFAGAANVWRTKTWGMGTMTLAEFRGHCNEWRGDFAVQCGDWQPIAAPSLNSPARGDRAGGAMAAVERTASDSSTAWAATTTGRVFISKNVDAEPAGAVAWTRLDALAANDPNRFVSGIHIDPANPNRACISYSGFSASTPATPGHVFEVTYNPVAGTASWVDRSHDLGDIPVTDVARDDLNGDLYIASDFGVFRLAAGSSSWTAAAPGMPNVEVAGLTIIPAARKLYVATHGLGAWLLNLP
ncbi:WD40/YVTN/BNR-like repeat-containing protein [Paucibacter soli]|uniref:WD40/YVTN/BNR-like repeat-containing protein n=1 Tax=Paucibacter soli TaxID=3133433 RepID=UPI0030A4E167